MCDLPRDQRGPSHQTTERVLDETIYIVVQDKGKFNYLGHLA
jgi:hypothetical protein